MVILNLPDEPNTPAGKAIQTAMAPSEEQLAAKSITNKFQLVFNSNPDLGDCIQELFLDLKKMELDLTVNENGRFEWIEWILSVPKNEIITLFFLNEDNKHRFTLVMEKIDVTDHTCFMSNSEYKSESLEHKLTVQFSKIEKIDPEGRNR